MRGFFIGRDCGVINAMRERLVTKTELELEISRAELKTWVTGKVQDIAQQSGGVTAIRLGKDLVKQLMEEIRLISLFATRHFGDSFDVTIRPAVGSQSYDAIVTSNSGVATDINFTEVTQAHDGEEEHLRMIHLERMGHVSLHGQVIKEGTKKTDLTVTVESGALDHREVISRELQRIKDAALRKAVKSYQPGTALVIQFEDFTSFYRGRSSQTIGWFL